MAQHTSATPPNATTGLAGDQPGSIPVFSSDPTLSDLPIDENGDAVPILYMSDGSSGVTGQGGDLVLAAPDGSGGVDIVIANDLSGSISLGIDGTGLL